MNGRRRRNDRVRTGASIPGAVLHLALVLVAATAALILVPLPGWQIAVVGTAALGSLLPQTMGGWLSIAMLAIGMLLAEPSTAHAMIAVLLVHLMHVLSSLLPVVPWRGRVVIAALRPTLVRLLVVQVVAQPVVLGVMLVWTSGGRVVEGAAIIGAAGVIGFAIVFLRSLHRRSDRA